MAEIRKAATAVLIRDGENGLETLLLKRSGHGTFGNMWVFPGGKVDQCDLEDSDNELDIARRTAVRETLEESSITVHSSDLLSFAHWIPPEDFPTRFATWFFIAKVDPDQSIRVDNHEIVDYSWVDARWAIDQHHSGLLPMVPPTMVTLSELGMQPNCEHMLAFYKNRGIFHYRPKVVKREETTLLMLYEGDSGYITCNPDLPGPRNRILLSKGICHYNAG